jgi:hypothetical protein
MDVASRTDSTAAARRSTGRTDGSANSTVASPHRASTTTRNGPHGARTCRGSCGRAPGSPRPATGRRRASRPRTVLRCWGRPCPGAYRAGVHARTSKTLRRPDIATTRADDGPRSRTAACVQEAGARVLKARVRAGQGGLIPTVRPAGGGPDGPDNAAAPFGPPLCPCPRTARRADGPWCARTKTERPPRGKRPLRRARYSSAERRGVPAHR